MNHCVKYARMRYFTDPYSPALQFCPNTSMDIYQPKLYKGSCETSFKKRYNNHKIQNVPLYKHDTKLSTEYWTLKTKQLNPWISWMIKGIYKSDNPTSKRCNLCLTEKLEILENPGKKLLNKRSEIISQCRHKNKYRLKTLASSMTSGDIT